MVGRQCGLSDGSAETLIVDVMERLCVSNEDYNRWHSSCTTPTRRIDVSPVTSVQTAAVAVEIFQGLSGDVAYSYSKINYCRSPEVENEPSQFGIRFCHHSTERR